MTKSMHRIFPSLISKCTSLYFSHLRHPTRDPGPDQRSSAHKIPLDCFNRGIWTKNGLIDMGGEDRRHDRSQARANQLAQNHIIQNHYEMTRIRSCLPHHEKAEARACLFILSKFTRALTVLSIKDSKNQGDTEFFVYSPLSVSNPRKDQSGLLLSSKASLTDQGFLTAVCFVTHWARGHPQRNHTWREDISGCLRRVISLLPFIKLCYSNLWACVSSSDSTQQQHHPLHSTSSHQQRHHAHPATAYKQSHISLSAPDNQSSLREDNDSRKMANQNNQQGSQQRPRNPMDNIFNNKECHMCMAHVVMINALKKQVTELTEDYHADRNSKRKKLQKRKKEIEDLKDRCIHMEAVIDHLRTLTESQQGEASTRVSRRDPLPDDSVTQHPP